jgi:hypothetical protein
LSERGVFAVDRGIFDHPLFAKEPFTEREAWIWLIKEAAWKDRAVRAGTAVIKLKRGECAHSYRFMADIWQWSKSRVERFVNRLKIETLVMTRSGTGVTVITICKYDEYQRVSLPRGTESGTVSGTEAGQQRDKPEDIKNIEDKKSIGGADAPNVIEFSSKYEFEGETIKVTPKTMADFRKDYRWITDLVGTLKVIDAYYTHEKPIPPGGKWFFQVCRWLQRENEEARLRRREETRGVEWG